MSLVLGDVIDIPTTGERFEFRKRAKDTNGELLEIDFHVKQFSPPPHIHARVEERVEVISGKARVRVDGKDWTVGPGETVVFPAGVGHTFQAVGEEMLHFRCEVRPVGGMEACFETIFGLYRDGKANKRGQPNLLQSVILAKEYGITLPGAPVALQKPAVTVLAAIGRLLGYRAKYERYSGSAS
jgi:quercetin dioxygenase-like cupin family protein